MSGINLTQKEIAKKQKRIEKIWDEIEEVAHIEGTGASSLIEELIGLEIEIDRECNM